MGKLLAKASRPKISDTSRFSIGGERSPPVYDQSKADYAATFPPVLNHIFWHILDKFTSGTGQKRLLVIASLARTWMAMAGSGCGKLFESAVYAESYHTVTAKP